VIFSLSLKEKSLFGRYSRSAAEPLEFFPDLSHGLSLESTAGRSDDKRSMTSTVKFAAKRALASGGSALSR
jgi:hypothetical protein